MILCLQFSIISPLQAKLGSDGRPRDGDSLSLKKEILSLKKENENRIHQSFERFLAVVLGKEGPGILALLGHKQETPFNRLFVASQSSADVCSLLVPHADDRFGTSNKGGFSVGFTLGRAVTISDVRIFSSDSGFPKSFDISVEGETVKSVREARELNGEHKDMTVSFAPIRGRKVRFTQTGPNWDDGSHFLRIKGIELLSTDSKYSRGVFATLVGESENEDPHKCPVTISASYFDFNGFHSINADLF